MNKLRLKFEKKDYIKYISHLDLMRVFQRGINRANLPINYSQGFNPHPIMSIAFPLPVGTVGKGEYIELEFKEIIDINLVISQLNLNLPKGISVLEGEYFEGKDPLIDKIYKAEYSIKIVFNNNVKNIKEEIENLFSKDEILVEKRTKKKQLKEVDIAHNIFEYNILNIEDNEIDINMYLSLSKKESIKPELVINALERYIEDLSVDYYTVVRERLISE